jgi:hypothetical protein
MIKSIEVKKTHINLTETAGKKYQSLSNKLADLLIDVVYKYQYCMYILFKRLIFI